MIERSVSERLHYAVLSVLQSYPNGEHQDYWAAWEVAVAKKMQGCVFTTDDLRSAFEALLQHGAVELTKPDAHRKHATKYEMRNGLGVDWRAFLLNGPFNVTITPSGKKYCEQLGNAKGIRPSKSQSPFATSMTSRSGPT
jgi:hypothetical protein